MRHVRCGTARVQLISGVFERCVLRVLVCTAHRLQCKTQHFPKHIVFPVNATRNVPEINCSLEQ